MSFLHDQDKYTYDRRTYTILDYLRDIGGLLGSFNGIFTGLIFIVNFNGLYHWLTSQLYTVQSMFDHASNARRIAMRGKNILI